MFSLPRDTQDVPVPAGSARNASGARPTASKINSFFINNRRRSDLWPGTDRTRGYNALKAIVGELYDLDIKYFVEVNFDGFKKVVDALGGVTINVQVPVVDDTFPGTTGRTQRLYIPSGIQHMDGDQALRYARSRHTSTDFDRGARQQRVLLSLREQADPQALIPRLPGARRRAQEGGPDRRPARPDRRAARARVADRHGQHPLVRVRAAALPAGSAAAATTRLPYVDRIRRAVKNAFTTDPRDEALRQALAGEEAQLWVLNGTGDTGRGASARVVPRVPRARRVGAARQARRGACRPRPS